MNSATNHFHSLGLQTVLAKASVSPAIRQLLQALAAKCDESSERKTDLHCEFYSAVEDCLGGDLFLEMRQITQAAHFASIGVSF